MTPPRIGYDVSFCADLHDRPERITGVGRVIESIAARLATSGDCELLLTGCYGSDPRPAYTSAKARRYWQTRWAKSTGFLEAAHSRFGLHPAYRAALVRTNAWDDRTLRPPARLLRKSLNALARWDGRARPLAGIDLFHSTFNPLPDASLFPTIPRIATIHDLIPLDDATDSTSKLLLRETLARIDPRRDWALCVSTHTRDQLCAAIDLPPERTMVAPLAAEPVFHPRPDPREFAAVRRRLGLPERFFLSVANPQPRKNIPRLIRCFQTVASRPENPAADLVLVGARRLGWGFAEIDLQITAAPELADRIHLRSNLSDDDLAVLYSHCIGFVFPSLAEGFGLPPLEALQCGAPVISANTTSLPEVVGNAAILIDPENDAQLTAALESLLHRPDTRAELAARATRQAARFSWEATTDRVRQLYRMALDG